MSDLLLFGVVGSLLSSLMFRNDSIYCLCVFSIIMSLSSMWSLESEVKWQADTIWTFVDPLSASLVMLSMWVMGISIIASNEEILWGIRPYYLTGILFGLSLNLLISFTCCDLSVFYLCFESCLFPLVVILYGWGGTPERSDAIIYLIVYTACSSVPLMAVIAWCMSVNGSSFIWMIFEFQEVSSFFWACCFTGFLVNLPMYPFHVWLPNAHVEAPVSGSLMLAAVILNLGGYGLIRFMSYMCYSFESFGIWCCAFTLLGMMTSSLICCRQVDVKSIVAYSSVGHMGFVILGIFSGYSVGYAAAVILMLSHGYLSCAMFYACSVISVSCKSRSVFLVNGMNTLLPWTSIFWGLGIFLNMGVPPSPNIIGEAVVMGFMLNHGLLPVFSIFMYFLMAGVISFYLFSVTFSSPPSYMSPYSSKCCQSREYTGLLSCFTPLVWVLGSFNLWV